MKTWRAQLLTCLAVLTLCSYTMVCTAQINPENLRQHIFHMADDRMKGRGTGSPEADSTAQYIAQAFHEYGLTPQGDKGYFQQFTAKVRRVLVADSIRQASNVIGFLDNKAEKTIVIGAHYDHLGMGHQGSSRDSLGVGKIHNGADDNASGVAGLLEIARHYSSNNIQEPFNLLFIAFGAEELGLVGSRYWTEQPTIPLERIHWMLNMDMIGRYQPEQGLAIIGYGTSPEFIPIFQGVSSPLKFNLSRDGNGGSDQTSFYKKNIPVLFLHTGGHDDYHKPGDDAEKINYAALHNILTLALEVIDASMHLKNMNFQWTN